jgi:hypothetical protein
MNGLLQVPATVRNLDLLISFYAKPTADKHNPLTGRGPCPMLNSLTNHNYIPHSGINLTRSDVKQGLVDGINFIASITSSLITVALSTSTTGNSSTFNLKDLEKHNVCEHDASLSRNDAYFGDDVTFNGPIWDAVKASFPDDVITIEAAADTWNARVAAARAANPDFDLTHQGRDNGISETGLYLMVFGDRVYGNATTDWVNTFFGKCCLFVLFFFVFILLSDPFPQSLCVTTI